jgi:hypothetical protein
MPGRVLSPFLPPAARRAHSEVGALASFEVLPRERPQRDALASAEADRERLQTLNLAWLYRNGVHWGSQERHVRDDASRRDNISSRHMGTTGKA